MTIYPRQYESDVVLRDGSTIRLRPVRPDDAEALRELHKRLSPDSQHFRFFALSAENPSEVSRLLRADYDGEFVLVAESGGRLSGVASYSRDPKSPDRAEVAFTIADVLQGRGVGTRMLETLAEIARDHHIRVFRCIRAARQRAHDAGVSRFGVRGRAAASTAGYFTSCSRSNPRRSTKPKPRSDHMPRPQLR